MADSKKWLKVTVLDFKEIFLCLNWGNGEFCGPKSVCLNFFKIFLSDISKNKPDERHQRVCFFKKNYFA